MLMFLKTQVKLFEVINRKENFLKTFVEYSCKILLAQKGEYWESTHSALPYLGGKYRIYLFCIRIRRRQQIYSPLPPGGPKGEKYLGIIMINFCIVIHSGIIDS